MLFSIQSKMLNSWHNCIDLTDFWRKKKPPTRWRKKTWVVVSVSESIELCICQCSMCVIFLPSVIWCHLAVLKNSEAFVRHKLHCHTYTLHVCIIATTHNTRSILTGIDLYKKVAFFRFQVEIKRHAHFVCAHINWMCQFDSMYGLYVQCTYTILFQNPTCIQYFSLPFICVQLIWCIGSF